MNEQVLRGHGKEIIRMPRTIWERDLDQAPETCKARLGFMSDEHHRVRYHSVEQIARRGEPLAPSRIAEDLDLHSIRVAAILEELERNLFFLVRNDEGHVSWAFPVTVDPTPHRLVFSTGERLHGAWAEDAIATPFVQGHLFGEELSVKIQTECGCCGKSMRLTVASDLHYEVHDSGAEPLVFEPEVDWTSFTDPNIIHGYWENSLFFWSEEHAREDRRRRPRVDGTYLTLAQSAYATRIVQGALFAFR